MGTEKLDKIRHSLSHLMSMAVQELYPQVGLGVGPAIENGFYQDYDLPESITPEILPRLEKRMREMIKEDIKFVQHDVDFAEAYKFYQHDPYKTEFIDDLKVRGEKQVSFYKSGWFDNLCAGPHVGSTKEINLDAFKLTKVAGAYWRGDEKNKMLQRIYGIAFETKEELADYLKMIEEAEKRDHRKLGKELDLFSFHEEGPGFPFWHPKGMVLRGALMGLHDELHKKADYQLVSTPILLSEALWHQSGHWDHYKDAMYFTKIDDQIFAIKPMNCPGVILIYKNCPRSYRELPLRFAENGEVHRHEPSGTLHGLFRVRAFRQDDAHIFAQENQIEEEIKNVVKLIIEFYQAFNFNDVEIELSTRPEKSMGSDEIWEKSESTLSKVLNDLGLKFKINEGDGAFYGPKIDFHIKDSIGRSWQCGTIQLDFSMPERFDLEYTDNKGDKKRPVMIHRTVIGSIQRFVGVLIEHYAGAFPTWLSPVQAMIIPVSEKFTAYGKEVLAELKDANIRAEIDASDESLGKRIRNAEKQKTPYILVVGEKEVAAKEVAVRKRGVGDLGSQKVEDFQKTILKEIKERLSE